MLQKLLDFCPVLTDSSDSCRKGALRHGLLRECNVERRAPDCVAEIYKLPTSVAVGTGTVNYRYWYRVPMVDFATSTRVSARYGTGTCGRSLDLR